MEKELKRDKISKEKAPKVAPKTDTSKVYELGYILLPSLSDEQMHNEVKTLSSLVSKNGGDMISSENPILIDLAYPMLKVVQTTREKCYQGYFGWMKFEIGSEDLTEIKKALDLSSSVVRYLLVKTVRENTLLNGKMMFRREEKLAKTEVLDDDYELSLDEIKPEVVSNDSSEDLDKSIDALVIN
jgi:ribosomal protein S6